MDNKACSELIGDELKKRIADFKQTLEENNYEKIEKDGYEYEDTIDRIVYHSLEVMEKILQHIK